MATAKRTPAKRTRQGTGQGTGQGAGQGTGEGKAAKGARKAPGTPRRRRAGPAADMRPWGLWTAALIAGVAVLRLAFNAFGLVPVHFDEAQYWAYGQELAWGHFSKPPLVGWVIRATTALGGDSTAWLRLGAVLAHGVTAALIFLTGRRLWDGRTGFWAAAGYTAAPGVTASAIVMTTDPVMMAFWALALYAWVRATSDMPVGKPTAKARAMAAPADRLWWAALGAAIGLATLSKYTGLAFAAGALGYGFLSARARDWPGTGIAAGVALLVVAPNLLWLAANDFVTIGHVAEDAAPAGARYTIGGLAEFLGAQLAVIGPAWFVAILAALWWRRRWLDDWRMRMLAWQTFALLGAIALLAFWTRAQPNWAAPAYVAGSLLAARIVLAHGWSWALKAQASIGAVAAIALYAAAVAYATMPLDLPRGADPFKKMRIGEPFCAAALGQMAEEGADVLLSNDRRRLSECMFLGNLTWDDVSVWNPGLTPSNHHELVSGLRPGDQRTMLLAVMSPEAARDIASHFDEAHEVETGTMKTHADRGFDYALWSVRGFRGY